MSVGEKEVGEGIATPSFAAAFIFNVIFINMEERKKNVHKILFIYPDQRGGNYFYHILATRHKNRNISVK